MNEMIRVLLLTLALPACVGVSANPGQIAHGTHDPRLVFVTSALYQGGQLGGLAGADASCMDRAAAAGLAGSYKAWLSDTSTAAKDRMTHATASYQLVDGTVVASSWSDLVAANLAHAIDLEETGQPHMPPPTVMLQISAWTATDWDGTFYVDGTNNACGDWNDLHGYALLGDTKQVGSNWTVGGFIMPCIDKAALYCIEQ